MTPTLHLALLGRFTATLDGQPLDGLRTTKAQALLAYLAVYRQPHSRHALAGLLWGEEAAEDAKNNLRVILANLNQLLPDHLESTRLTITLRSDQPCRIDLDEFQTMTSALADSTKRPEIASLQTAAALYRGDFLADLYVAKAPAFEEWLLTQRERWRRQQMEVLETLADRLLAERRYAEAVGALRSLLTVEPWFEEGHRQLMLTFSRLGDFNEALTQYAACRSVLAAELDVEPMPETTALYERILVARQARPHQLPTQTTPLVGRRQELAQLLRLLADPASRLITITGLGGVGKSSLALAVAHQANQEHALLFLNGVVFVPLAGVESAEQLPLVLAAALNLHLSGRSTPADEVLAFLRNQELLFVLDNFEHLLPAVASPPAAARRTADGSPKSVALLARILRANPHLKILITSREPLQLAAEWRLDLAGLPVPPLPTAAVGPYPNEPNESIEFFALVAQQAQPSFAFTVANKRQVALLCRLLGGLPLAIKLAAAWLRVMSLERIVAELEQSPDLLASRLRDAPARQRSMRVIFVHSWQLLGPSEQRVFARLAVFRGSFAFAAAHQVAAASPFVLETLGDRSLLQFQPNDRYELPVLLRQYAEEQLATSPAEAEQARNAHADYYMSLLERYGRYANGGDQRAALAQIGVEIDNVRTAWRRAVQNGDSHAIGRAALALCWYYDTVGYYLETVLLLTTALQRLEQVENAEPVLAQLQLHLGWAYIRVGLLNEAQTAFSRSQAFYEQLAIPPPAGVGTDPTVGLGVLASIRGNFDEATRLSQQAARAAEARGDTHNLANALSELASAAFARGHYSVAETHGLRAVMLLESSANWLSLAYVLSNLGQVARAQGDYTTASRRYQRSYEIHEQMDSPGGKAANLNDLAQIAWLMGDFAGSQQQFEQSLALHRLINDRGGMAASLNGLGRCALAGGDWPQAAHHFSQALSVALEMDFAPLALGILCSIAELLLQTANAAQARNFLAFTIAHPACDQETNQRATRLLAVAADVSAATPPPPADPGGELAWMGRHALAALSTLTLPR